MWLTNEWYYFTSVLDASTCKKIVELWSKESLPARVDRKKGVSVEESKAGSERYQASKPETQEIGNE